ncbi:Amino acid transporter AVT1C-like 2, partial [Homarus americanus]
YPYPALAEKVGGIILRRVVTVMQDLAIFGAAVPFMLLASETLQQLVEKLAGLNFSFCYWLLITTIILTPLLWLGTPKDLGVVTWIGASSVVLVSILTLVGLILDAPDTSDPAPVTPSLAAAAYCFAAVAFQFDIHPMILTVQMDMRQKHRLPHALVVAFIVWLTRAIFQLLLCLVLGINTLFQDLENSLHIPDEFGWRRICLRTTVMLLVLFVCESIPHFAVAIELVGGLLVTPFIFIFPPAFHILIKHKASGRVDVRDVVLAANIMCLGAVGCIAATVESFIQVVKLKEFAPPCYINITAASAITDSTGFPNP